MNLSDIARYTIYVDLDGVLSNLDKFVIQHTGKTFQELRGQSFTRFTYEYRQRHGSFFDRLEKMPDADLLWNYVMPYRPNILSATGPLHKESTEEKIRWVSKHLPNVNEVYTVISSQDKYHYAKANAVLIDDTIGAIENWERAGGIGIVHKSAAQTIKKLIALGI